MANRLCALLLLLALPLLAAAQDDGDLLLRRLQPISGGRWTCAVVYSRYESGRPRLVVAALKGEPGLGEVLLVRFPDTGGGRPRLLHRLESESPSVVEIVRVVDPKDVLVTFVGGRSTPATLYRVAGNRLVNIAETSVYGNFHPVDLDGDGVPELINSGCCDWTPCGVAGMFGVEKFDGRRFVSYGRGYILSAAVPAGASWMEQPLLVREALDPNQKRRKYVIHIYNAGATHARVQFDGREMVTPKKAAGFRHIRLPLEVALPPSPNDCHTLRVLAEGPPDSGLHVLVEELTNPLSSPPAPAPAARPR